MTSASPRRPRRGRAIGAAALALIVGASLALVATPAYAYTETLNPANEIAGGDYDFTITPTGRTQPAPGETSALQTGPDEVRISKGCPEGYREGSRTYLILPDGTRLGGAERRSTKGAGSGLDGGPIFLTEALAGAYVWRAPSRSFQTGTMQMVITCDDRYIGSGASNPVGDSPYFALPIDVDVTAQTWQVKGETVKVGTETSFTVSNVTHDSATLTASVTPVPSGGAVQFFSNDEAVGELVTVQSDGSAVYGLSGLEPDNSYTIVARYLGSATHEASSSAPDTVFTPLAPEEPEPADTEDATIGVQVPPVGNAPEKGLTITVTNAAVTLDGGDRNVGQAWVANGRLAPVTVNDDRPSKAGTDWSLTGAATKFTSGTNEIAATALSWTPGDATGTAGHGTEGSAASDLSQAKTLASGKTLATRDSTTSVGAELTLTVPSTAVAGNYTAKLTLTLI